MRSAELRETIGPAIQVNLSMAMIDEAETTKRVRWL
jgi:hypothetical protein